MTSSVILTLPLTDFMHPSKLVLVFFKSLFTTCRIPDDMHQEYLTDMVSAKNVLTLALQYSQWTRMLVLHVYLSPPLLMLLIIVALVNRLYDSSLCKYKTIIKI